MGNDAKDKMQGEGDDESAKRYTDDKRAFVGGGKWEEAAASAGEQSREERKAAAPKALGRARKHVHVSVRSIDWIINKRSGVADRYRFQSCRALRCKWEHTGELT